MGEAKRRGTYEVRRGLARGEHWAYMVSQTNGSKIAGTVTGRFASNTPAFMEVVPKTARQLAAAKAAATRQRNREAAKAVAMLNADKTPASP